MNAMMKPMEEMTADELFELATQRKQQEQEAQQAARLARMESLKAERAELIASHKKALAAIDKELKALGGRGRRTSATKSRGSSLGQSIVELLTERSPMSSDMLKERLDEQGHAIKNLSQQLAYLKRKGQIKSPGRGLYAIVR